MLFFMEITLLGIYFLQSQQDRPIYIRFQQNDKGDWVPTSGCHSIPIQQLMGISGGIALAILIVVITTAYLVMLYRDRKRWKEFEAEKKENEKRFGEAVNPIYGEWLLT